MHSCAMRSVMAVQVTNSYVPPMSPFLYAEHLIFFMDTLMNRMGVQFIFACQSVH